MQASDTHRTKSIPNIVGKILGINVKKIVTFLVILATFCVLVIYLVTASIILFHKFLSKQ